MNNDLMERYVTLSTERKRLEVLVDGVKRQLTAMEDAVLEGLVEAGLQSVKTTTGSTIYLHRQLWAGPVDGDYERACEALNVAGLGDLVQTRFNTSTLSAWCRERDKAGEPLPPSFDGAIHVAEKSSVRVRGL